jgi:hypothetical protein
MSSEDKYEKISLCQLIGMVTTNMLKHLDNMHGDTYLKIVQDYLDEIQILKRMISPAFILSKQIMLHPFMAGWSGL